MKNQLLKKVKPCILIFIGVLLSTLATAQIIYYDLIPDVTRSCTTQARLTSTCSVTDSIDVNNDSIFDYAIKVTTSSAPVPGCQGFGCIIHFKTSYVYILPLSGNAVAVNSSGLPLELFAGDIISSALTWGTSTSQILRRASGSTTIGYFGNWTMPNGYLGIRFTTGGQPHFGWLRMSLAVSISANTISNVSSNISIKDLAFNSSTGQSIMAGQNNSQNALITSLTTLPLCAGNAITIPYVIAGTFNAGNVFTAQLSDNIGSFANPVVIGTNSSQTFGSISALIPIGTASGAYYKIRIVSDDPASTGPENPLNIAITNGATHPVISGNAVICGNSSTSLSTSGVSGFTYQWLLNDTAITGAISNSRSVTAVGNYSCIVTSGCGRDTSNTINVTVVSLPTASITSTGNSICQGDSLLLNANTGLGMTYAWRNNNVVIPGAADSTYYATAAGYYSVAVTNSSGCTAYSNSITINLSTGAPSPVISVNGLSTICQGINSGYLTTTSVTGNSYQWILDGFDIPNAKGYYYYPSATGNYSCRISNGCGTVTSNIILFTILPSPSAVITANGPVSYCPGTGVSLSANTNGGTYQWLKNGITIPGATDSTYFAKAFAYYAVMETNANGCVKTSGYIDTYLDVVDNYINPQGEVNINPGDSVMLEVSSTAGYGYQWKRNGINISGATQFIYYASSAGNFRCTITNQCTHRTTEYVKVMLICPHRDELSMPEINNSVELSITPNPLTRLTIIKWQQEREENVSLKIYAINGQLIKTLTEQVFTEGENEVEWKADYDNGQNVNAGIYILSIQSTSFSSTSKLIVTQ